MKSPYSATWNWFDEDSGELIMKSLAPDDVLKDLAEGMGSYQLVEKYCAPLEVVEHVIMLIPYMVAWRDEQYAESGSASGVLMQLPRRQSEGG